MTQPGTLGSQIPPGEDALVRRVADLERQLRELGPSVAKSFNTTVAQLNAAIENSKAQFATGNSPVISPTISPTVASVSTSVTVPAYATSCGYSTFAVGAGSNTTGSDGFITVRVTVTYGSYTFYTFQSSPIVPAGGVSTVVTPMVDTINFAAGGGTLTLTASINNGSGTWTDTSYNTLFAEGLFVFQS